MPPNIFKVGKVALMFGMGWVLRIDMREEGRTTIEPLTTVILRGEEDLEIRKFFRDVSDEVQESVFEGAKKC